MRIFHGKKLFGFLSILVVMILGAVFFVSMPTAAQSVGETYERRDSCTQDGDIRNDSGNCEDIRSYLDDGSNSIYWIDDSGSNTNPGTEAQPFADFSAVTGSGFLSPGDAVVVRGGTYYGEIIPQEGGTASDKITFVGYPGEDVTVSGAEDLNLSWSDSDGDGVWESTWPYDSLYRYQPDPMSRREMIIDQRTGEPLQLVTTRAGVDAYPDTANNLYSGNQPGVFYIDGDRANPQGEEVFLEMRDGSNPNNLDLDTSRTTRLFEPKKDPAKLCGEPTQLGNYHLMNMTFTHTANNTQYGAVCSGNGSSIIEDITAEWNNGTGIALSGDGLEARGLKAHDNGSQGIRGANGGQCLNCLIEHSSSNRNNWKGYIPFIGAGGGKFIRTENTTFQYLTYIDNNGSGLWLDYYNFDNTIRNSYFEGNVGAGVFLEYNSNRNRVYNNVFIDQKFFNNQFVGVGVLNIDALDNVIAYNTMIGNDGAYKINDTGERTDTNDITVYNNLAIDNIDQGESKSHEAVIFADPDSNLNTYDLDGNAYWESDAGFEGDGGFDYATFSVTDPDSDSLINTNTLSTFQDIAGYDPNGLIGTPSQPNVLDYQNPETNNNWRLAENSQYIGQAVALPSGVDPITTDYFGNSRPTSGGDIGAHHYTASSPPADTTAPTITNVQATNVGTDSATISWDTDESADSQVEYGTTDSYGQVEADSADTTNHSLALSNLSPDTTYHYRVSSTDGAGNTQTGSDRTFTTDADTTNVTITKTVTNDDDGTASPSDFTLTVRDSGGGTVDSFPGDASGTDVELTVGEEYTVSESGAETSNYNLSFSGDCDAGGTFTAQDGGSCTLTNDDVTPPNDPPTVSFDNEPSGETGEQITLSATAADQNNNLQDVTLREDGSFLASSTGPTVDITKQYDTAGTYTITAEATDAEGLTATDSFDLAISEAPPEMTTVTITKTMVNDDDGAASANDFTLNVRDSDGNSVDSFSGSENGTDVTLEVGQTYTISESGGETDDYTTSFSGDCDSSGAFTAQSGGSCTVTNDDIPPATTDVTITKTVTNDDDGTASPSDFTLTVRDSGGNTVDSFAGASGGTDVTLVIGESYTVSESGSETDNYTTSFSGDCDGSGTFTAQDGSSCTLTNDDNTPPPPQNDPPTVSFNNEPSGETGEQITLSATAADTDGNLGEVALYEEGRFLASTSDATVATNVQYNTAGTHAITAEAIDTGGLSATDSFDLVISEAPPATTDVTITKNVTNDDNGTASADDFTLTVTDSGGDTVDSFAGAGGGTAVTLVVGDTYTVSESGSETSNYNLSFSGDCDASGTFTVQDGSVCTLINDDITDTDTGGGGGGDDDDDSDGGGSSGGGGGSLASRGVDDDEDDVDDTIDRVSDAGDDIDVPVPNSEEVVPDTAEPIFGDIVDQGFNDTQDLMEAGNFFSNDTVDDTTDDLQETIAVSNAPRRALNRFKNLFNRLTQLYTRLILQRSGMQL